MGGKRTRTPKSKSRQMMDELTRAINRLWPDVDCVAREDCVLIIREIGDPKRIRDMVSAVRLLGDPFKISEGELLNGEADDYDTENETLPTNPAA